MVKRLFSLPFGAILLVLLGTPAMTAEASISARIRAQEDHSGRIETAEQCLSHIKAYRGAITFLDERLEKSPPEVAYVSKSGERIVVPNRRHMRMQQDRELLSAGMQARARACQDALSG